MQPDDDLHVLAHRARTPADVFPDQPVLYQRSEVAAGTDHRLLLEDPKTPDRIRIESRRSSPVRPVVKDRRYSTI